jgi:predicted DNA binding CopG/RHH family protein
MTRRDEPNRQPTTSRIPEFASREEEAEWWDTHDITDYLDEFKPVKVRFGKNLSEGITIRLDKETLAELRRRAHEQGIGPTTLARMWILERLRSRSQDKQAG